MKKLMFTFIALLAMAGMAYAQAGGLVYHEVQIVNESGKMARSITTVTVRLPATTDAATIYKDAARTLAITQPMTTATANTTLANGSFYWYGPDGWDYTIGDGTNSLTNYGHDSMTASDSRIVFPSYVQAISSTSYTDEQSATFGSDSDFVLSGGSTTDTLNLLSANQLEAAYFNIGEDEAGIDLKVFGTTSGDYWWWDASADFFEIVGDKVKWTLIEAASDALNIDITGALGGFDLDTTNGAVALTAGGSDNGDMLLTAGDDFGVVVTGEIDIDSSAGAVTLSANAAEMDVTINSALGSVLIKAEETGVADAILLEVDGDASSTLRVYNDTGTSVTDAAASIQLTSDVGGIGLKATGIVDARGIVLDAPAGGVVIATSAAHDVDIDTGQFLVNTTHNVASAIALVANSTSTSDTIVLTNTSGSGTGALTFTATAGGIDIDAAATKEINIAGGNVAIVNKTAGATAITAITNVDVTDQIVVTNTLGTNEAAIDITSTAGGVDIDAAAGKNLALNGGQVLIEAEDSVASAISLITNTGVLETIVVNNMVGTDDASINIDSVAGGMTVDLAKSFTLTSTEGALDSIVITSTGGGIDLVTTGAVATEDIDITSSASVNVTSAENLAAAIVVATSGGGGSAETIDITNDQGTSASSTTQTDAAIQLEATLGGIGLSSGLAAADAIRIETSGTDGQMTLHSIAGTTACTAGEFDSAIQLYAPVGGIGLLSKLNNANAIRIEANGGVSETVNISSLKGTGAGSIDVDSALGGITIATNAAAKDISLNSVLGSIKIVAEEDAAEAILLHADSDSTTSTIKIHNDTGNASAVNAASIQLTSDIGAINLVATGNTAVLEGASAVQLTATAGGIELLSKLDATNAIKLTSDGGTSGAIDIYNDQGEAADSIHLLSDAGGITATATAGPIVITAGGGTAGDMTVTVGDEYILDVTGGIEIDSAEEAADAISLTASGTAGGITLDAGTGLINFSEDNLANIGDISCDEITEDANDAISYQCKTETFTIGHTGDDVEDYQWTTAVDHTAQNLQLGDIPAFCRIIDVTVVCTQAMVGQTAMTMIVGSSSADDGFIATTTCDALNEVIGSAAGGASFVAVSNAATEIWVQGDPDDNTWADMSAGVWDVMVTYIDVGAAVGN